MTETRRPLHLVILAGVSTCAYAVSLATVTTLQSRADQALIADRAPVVSMVDRAATEHDRLATAVDAAARRYGTLALGYDLVTGSIGAYEGALDELTARADALTESVRTLPARIQLPSVPSIPAVAPRTTRPATHATTGASG